MKTVLLAALLAALTVVPAFATAAPAELGAADLGDPGASTSHVPNVWDTGKKVGGAVVRILDDLIGYQL